MFFSSLKIFLFFRKNCSNVVLIFLAHSFKLVNVQKFLSGGSCFVRDREGAFPRKRKKKKIKRNRIWTRRKREERTVGLASLRFDFK